MALLESSSLGERHKHFNKLVHDAISNEQCNPTKINYTDNDIDNLLKIAIACKTKNLDYIIDVLKCEDMLYVTKAIKQSTWLITEQQYAHIINPDYLYTHLFPHMLTKAINKLLLHVRLHLKDEKRVEEFYKYLKAHDKPECDKWLLNCSIPFIEKMLKNQRGISLQMFKRLCKRSVKFLKYFDNTRDSNGVALSSVLFLIKPYTDHYLNIVETCDDLYYLKLGPKYTEFVMNKCPNRILNNFDVYKEKVDLSVVAKYMNKENIKDFVLKQAKDDKSRFFSVHKNSKHFIEVFPIEERYEFVKKIYGYSYDMFHDEVPSDFAIPFNDYSKEWFQYAPFYEVFVELKKLILLESDPTKRNDIISLLIKCAKSNPQHVSTLLRYYYNKHRNESPNLKLQFVNDLISQTNTNEFDSGTWNTLDKLFHSLDVYTETENSQNIQTCLEAIVLYKVLHDEPVPDIVEKKIHFNTFNKYQKSLSNEQQDKIFKYLLSCVSKKLENITTSSEIDFQMSINLLLDAFNLLKDWKKDLKDSNIVFDKFRESIKIKKNHEWNVDLTSLYKINKTWQRYFFADSITLCPSEDVYLNVLKHDHRLLTQHSNKLNELTINNTISLRRFLAKLRIYWQDSLAKEMTEVYLNNFRKIAAHRPVIRGLFQLLPKAEIEKIAKQYSPKESKIDYNEEDHIELSLRKHIAKHLFIARPLTSLDLVLMYAKGDFLQYAVPSLNSIMNNISCVESREHISKFLKAPVSLQKYGLRFAFVKLQNEELKPIFSDVWKSTNNSTIRTHVFTHTFNLLCKAKEPSDAKSLWELLDMFIDHLGTDENIIIYNKLGHVQNVPAIVQCDFFIKSYKVLNSLRATCQRNQIKISTYIEHILDYVPKIIHLLDVEFVENTLLEYTNLKQYIIFNIGCDLTKILASYILHGQDEEEHCGKFKRVLLPVLELGFKSWNSKGEEQFRFKFDWLICTLIEVMISSVLLRKTVVPVKLFLEIEKVVTINFSAVQYYERCTIYKLLREYIKLVAVHQDMSWTPNFADLSLDEHNDPNPEEIERFWNAVHVKVCHDFGSFIIEQMKEDNQKYFPTISVLFSVALAKAFEYLQFSKLNQMEVLKFVISNSDCDHNYIFVCEMDLSPDNQHYGDEEQRTLAEIIKKLSAHPSIAVKMHYQKFLGTLLQNHLYWHLIGDLPRQAILDG